MLIDCFTFFNELDLLECRLEYLYDKVDRFVLVEASISHSGKEKPFYFLENKDRYQKYLDKIIHVPLNISSSDFDWEHDIKLGYSNASWQVENLQRNGILKGLVTFPDDAIIMISDLDEIPDLTAIDRAKRLLETRHAVALETYQFYYNLGQRLLEPWPATVISKKERLIKTSPQSLRDRKNNLSRILKAGWHLTYFNDAESIKNKIMNFAHQEYNRPEFTDINYINEKIKKGQELYGRPFPMIMVNANELPEYFLKSFRRYLSEMPEIKHYAEQVEGFFDLIDFDLYKKVVDYFPDQSHFVEVGSYKGRSSAFMAVEIALSGKQIQFDCVDTWEGSKEHQQGQAFEDLDVVESRLFDVFTKNMEPVKSLYRPVRMTSVEAAKTYQDQSLDFVFIDAAHDYENVLADILAWAPKVKSQGIISGHDWHHLPIKQAVQETLTSVNVIGNCWYAFKE